MKSVRAPRPFDQGDAQLVLESIKRLGDEDDADLLLAEARTPDGCGRGGRMPIGGHKLRWQVCLSLSRRDVWRAWLYVEGAPIVGLDHHYDVGKNFEVPAGYHWDFYPPLRPLKVRGPANHLNDQDPLDVLAFLFKEWNIELLRPLL